MYHIGDVVVYGTEGVCEVKEITEVRFGKETNEYYILCPVRKESDTFYVPTSADKVFLRMRPVLTASQVDDVIAQTEGKETAWIGNERERVEYFKKTLLYGKCEDVLLMARAIYRQQIRQLESNKRLHAVDERFLKEAEKLIIDEISYVKGIDSNEILPLITRI
ncbi:MAG: hypothetical protein MJ171_06330 [Clostridia bacterium]|nr:hypothetical protein [Clostridia bacterium]